LNKTDVKGFTVEGIGKDFVPDSISREYIDDWVKVYDKESYAVARDLIKQEGLLCGGSCGSAVYGAFKYLKDNNLHKNKDLRIVVILPDSIRNYLTKFCCDDWMVQKGFNPTTSIENKAHPLYGKSCADLKVK